MEGEKCSRCASLSIAGYIEESPACHSCLVAYCTPAVHILPNIRPSTRLCGQCSVQLADSELSCHNCGYLDPGLGAAGVGNSVQLSPSASPYWTCVCGYQNNGENQCQLCTRPFLIPRNMIPQANSSPVPSVLWNCSNCGSTGNTGGTCLTCHTGCPQKSQDQQPPIQACWTCPKCAYSFNAQVLDTCQNCGNGKAEDTRKWMCPNCSLENSEASEVCTKCHVRHGWTHYLMHKKVPLTPDKKEWICSKCTMHTAVTEAVCIGCGKNNGAIERGLSARGNENPLVAAARNLIRQVKNKIK